LNIAFTIPLFKLFPVQQSQRFSIKLAFHLIWGKNYNISWLPFALCRIFSVCVCPVFPYLLFPLPKEKALPAGFCFFFLRKENLL